MIVAVSSVLNEADIIRRVIDHLVGQGVDQFVISDGGSNDPTRERMEHPLVGRLNQDGPFDQGAEITRLAHIAADLGATWIIPFDADEFWCDPLGGTVAEVLNSQSSGIGKVFAATYGYRDWNHRFPQKPLSKIAFRPTSDMKVHWGNHNMSGGTGEAVHGVLEVRELQYRDWDHFLAKIEKARQLFASWDVPREHGHHMRRLVDMNEAQLRDEWANYQSQPATYAPIA